MSPSLDATAEVVKQLLILEIINVVNVPQHATIDKMTCIVHSLHAVLGESHLDEPADEFAAIENLAIDTYAPSVRGRMEEKLANR